MSVRVRFAPSPTGFLHVGSARTALFNWLMARSTGGTFILRSDDTDVERGSPEYYQDILAGLAWLGLDWDEGVERGGPYAPYRQSERLDRYREVAAGLVESGHAYPCFCTQEELEERRGRAQAEGRPPGYDGRCRLLDPAEATRRRAAGEPSVLRLAVPRPGATVFTDLVKGEVRFDHDHVEDFVLARSDGSPTYQLASAVDDVDHQITHVIRGEDLLSSTPKHILIAAAMGRGGTTRYGHLSLLMGPDGRKLSKRHGDTALHWYRRAGYLPEAMTNYLALLGWSFGDETIVARDDMPGRFRIEDVSTNPAIFDNEKLTWMNGVYLRALPADDFLGRTIPLIEQAVGRTLTDAELARYEVLAPDVQERVKLLTEVPEQVAFLFGGELTYDDDSWTNVMGTAEARVALDGARAALDGVGEWRRDEIETALRRMLDEAGLSARKGLQPVRVAVTGSSVSPPLFESIEVLGRDTTLARLEAAFRRL